MELRKRYALVLPVTVDFIEKISPDPPALWTHHPMVARAVIGAANILTRKRYLRRVGGIKRRGNWIIQKRK
jgi:hypothetical protein